MHADGIWSEFREPEKRERIIALRRRRLNLGGEISTEQLGETNVEPNKENVALPTPDADVINSN